MANMRNRYKVTHNTRANGVASVKMTPRQATCRRMKGRVLSPFRMRWEREAWRRSWGRAVGSRGREAVGMEYSLGW
jgi:hypothetical protein